MAKENFILLSLEDEKTKKIANIVSNDTSKKILDYLSEKESATLTEISDNTKIPLSSVQYNMNLLVESGLILNKKFHYSEKGKEVNHYSIANKYIIITPKKTTDIKNLLKDILPVTLISVFTTGIIYYMNNFKTYNQDLATSGVLNAEIAQPQMMAKSMAIEPVTTNIINSEPNVALWFLTGSVFTIIVYLIIKYIRGRKK